MQNFDPDYLDVPIRPENRGIWKLRAVVRELRLKSPGNLEQETPIVLGETPRIYVIVGDFGLTIV
jgi:hypothetical protein